MDINLLIILTIAWLMPGTGSEPETIITEFYSWYFNEVRSNRTDTYQPKFIADENGMSTLDFSTYIKNLRNYNFSERLIGEELNTYYSCISNLKKIKFSDLQTNFGELDYFEGIGCDYFNSLRWTGGMDDYDGVKVVASFQLDNNRCLFQCNYFLYDERSNQYDYYGQFNVTMIKTLKKWEIENID